MEKAGAVRKASPLRSSRGGECGQYGWQALLEPPCHWVPLGRRRGESRFARQPVMQFVEDIVNLLGTPELSHVDVADLRHDLAARQRGDHEWVAGLLQGPGTAELKETHRAAQKGGGDQFDDQPSLLQLTTQLSAHVGPGRDAGRPR